MTFQLNIAASGGAPRVQKKKKSTFRAKKNAKKSAKGKAQLQTHGDVKRPVSRPPRTIKPIMEKKEVETRIPEKEEPVEQSEVVESEEEDAPEEESDDELMEAMNAVETEPEAITAAVETVVEEEPKTPEETTEGETKEKEKAFGTRKNPNKAAYEPTKFTSVRATIDNVLDRPLASSSSEKIFAHTTFESMQLHPRMIEILKKDTSTGGFAFSRPTNVQVKTIPQVLLGKDVLVKSETGSGKTLSYLLPIVQKLQSIEPRVGRQDGCLALILAPTRELCLQIQETAEKLTKAFVFLVPGVVVGGEKKKAEKARLRKGISILIATPGRLADHLVNTQSFNYARLQFLVLDEADRLLDMGFQKQITQILEIIDATTKNNQYTGGRRQNVLVSATINSGVQELAKMSLTKPVLIDADKDNQQYDAEIASNEAAGGPERFSTPHQLMQHFMIVPTKTRLCALSCFLRQELTNPERKQCKIVVFMSTCDAVDFHYELFQKCAWPSRKGATVVEKTAKKGVVSPLLGEQGALFRLHGNIPQQERMTAFKNFCTTTTGVLFCTDIAARGLNLPTVQWIVQYDPPTETRDYVHRVGRTARSGNKGSSLLFLMPSESEYLDYLKKHNLTLNALSLEKTITRVANGGGFSKSKKKLLHEVIQSDLQYLFEQTLLGDKELFELACQGFHSFVRSYATHSSDTRSIFHVRGLHFGHIAKSFALREPPASSKLRDTGINAKKGTLQKRKERDDKEKERYVKKTKREQQQKRKYVQQVSEFAD
ncbi:hypothetical protein Poli38472_008577 [Pythium oligandrum]|uniref:ATP-dependent RNA helicase n=1 Tax=Pythium oligandrum TaxID=41045 RepID=A0A8K1C3Q3_PYTOL|nr:hypothetical protein Poli38472_008577 [Pythium oligandrum]|eukprot:TMW55929.1 hypothetical protein Poli38472_008577 [Pythium oligandrum]